MNEYFTANGGLGLGANFNVFISDRSDGKTFDCKYRALKRFQKRSAITVYMRRWKTEFTPLMVNTFFNEVLAKKKDEFEWVKTIKADKYGIRIGKINPITKKEELKYCIFFAPLTVANKLKSNFDPTDIEEIDFDEYVPLDGRYAPEEMRNLLEFYETCDRQRGKVKLCIFGNRIKGNILFLNYLNIDIKIDENYKTRLYKNGTLMVQIYHNDFRREVRETNPIMELTKGTNYEVYMKGGVLDLGYSCIMERPKDSILWCSFITENGEGSIWNYNEIYFVSDKKVDYNIVITDKPIKDTSKLYSVCTNPTFSSFFKSVYRYNRLYATSEKAWELFKPIFKLISMK